MILVDYTNVEVLIIAVLFFLIMNLVGCIKKKAWFVMTGVIVGLAMFILHVLIRDFISVETLKYNTYIDFACLAINIPLLLIIDEIETRRGLIENVFENRYKKNKNTKR